MRDFDEIGKKMPYGETDEMVDAIINRCTEKAISAYGKRKSKVVKVAWLKYVSASVAAAAIVVAVTFATLQLKSPTVNAENYAKAMSGDEHFDRMLGDLSANDLDGLAYYCTTQYIPEY